jgi:Tfp pilus assembly protein PilW
MGSAAWAARIIILTGIGALGLGTATAAPVASAQAAGPARVAGAPVHSIQSAAAGPAPLVRDAGATRSKRGMAAPAMSGKMLSANAQRQVMARRFLRMLRHNASAGAKCRSRACRTGLPEARDLPATQRAQINGYYCGPATVSEMLAQMGKRVTQVKAARQLRTTRSGTNWSDGTGYPVPNVLNRNQKKNNYVAVALPWSPTRAQVRTYETDLVTDVNHHGGVPLAGNAYEVAGGPHLVGNPVNQTIFHWFDIRGYKKFGTVTDYEDSVHGASSIGWSTGVPAYSSMASTAIVAILGARGYAW